MITISKLLKATVALGLVLSLVGCSNNQAEESKTTIRFATWDSSEDLTYQQNLVDKFNQEQSDIQVTLEAYGGDYDTKIAAGMGAKDAPDVMYMWNYPAYYNGLEKLDSYITKEGDDYKNNFYETLWSYNKIGEDIYGIPVGYTSHVLYYNKDLFDAAGVAYPTNDWTWEDLKSAAATITQKDSGVTGFAFPREYDPYDFEMYLWSNGTALSDDSGNLNGYVNSDAAVQVCTMFQDMEKEGIAVATEGYGSEEMVSAKVAMIVNGSWPISSFKDAGLNFGVVQIPMMKAGDSSVSILSSSGLSMSKDSKQKDAAWEFIKFWTSEEANIARIDYELPVLKSVVTAKDLQSDPTKSVFYTMLEQSKGYTPTSFKTQNWSEISENLALAFEKMFNPTVLDDPKSVLDEVANQ